jgi:hypothetical protein
VCIYIPAVGQVRHARDPLRVAAGLGVERPRLLGLRVLTCYIYAYSSLINICVYSYTYIGVHREPSGGQGRRACGRCGVSIITLFGVSTINMLLTLGMFYSHTDYRYVIDCRHADCIHAVDCVL